MNFYQFLKSLQEGVGDGCGVYASPWTFMGKIHGATIDIIWTNSDGEQLAYRFVVPEEALKNEGFLDNLCEYTVEKARREFRVWEVGEE